MLTVNDFVQNIEVFVHEKNYNPHIEVYNSDGHVLELEQAKSRVVVRAYIARMRDYNGPAGIELWVK